jgi:thioesterase domain-containing protein/acyl carrier protein
MWGGSAAVLAADGELKQVGTGEILVKSPGLMSGYLDRPDLTAVAMHRGWYRTGDRGAIDEQGRLWLTGRIKDEINRAGFKIQPAEIDALLEKHSAISEACVFGIADPLGGEAVAAAVRLRDDAQTTPESLHSWCRQRVRREAIPERWFFVSEIPRNARGKVSRDGVRRVLGQESSPDRKLSVVPQESDPDSVHIRIATAAVKHAWIETLGEASYFQDIALADADADSLELLRMWLLIEKALGKQLPLDIIEAGPTPGELAASVAQNLRARSPASDISAARRPVVFLLPPAGGSSLELARFRAAFKGAISFVTIEYPDWRKMIDANGGFDFLVNAAVSQILAMGEIGDQYLLAGYSFGGLVAMEVARRLLERGKKVHFIGLLDTRAAMAKAPKRWRAIVAKLVSRSAFRTLKTIDRLAKMLPPKRAILVEHELNVRLRMKGFDHQRPNPLPMPVTLYKSDDPSPASSEQWWLGRCTELHTVPIGGTHHSLFEPPHLDKLRTSFLAAIETVNSDTDLTLLRRPCEQPQLRRTGNSATPAGNRETSTPAPQFRSGSSH